MSASSSDGHERAQPYQRPTEPVHLKRPAAGTITREALRQLDATRGFELGVGPSIVVVDEGIGRSLTTNTITSDVYAFIFDRKGLMAQIENKMDAVIRYDLAAAIPVLEE